MTIEEKYSRLKKAFLIVFGLFILSLFTIGLMIGHNVREQNRRFEDARTAQATIATQTARIDSVDEAFNKEREIRLLETRKNKAALDSVGIILTQQRARNAANRAKIQPKLDSVPEIAEFVTGLDLEIQELGDVNTLQLIGFAIERKTLHQEIDGLKVKLLAMDQINKSRLAETEQARRETKKQHRGKVLWKVMFFGSFLAASYIATQ